MSELKGNYYYFKDLVDKNSEDYGKIAVFKADSDYDSWRELSIRHKKRYGELKKPIETMYQFLERREVG